MMRAACAQASAWLSARRAGLSAASALRLEEHLAHCVACGELAGLLDRLRAASDAGALPLHPSARQRALSHALASTATASQPRAAGSIWSMPRALSALGAVALVVLAIALRPSPPAARDRLLSGQLAVAGQAVPAGAALASDAWLQSENGARLVLAHARLELRAHSAVRWDAPTRALRLQRGSISVDVDRTRHQSFAVTTEKFSVLVLGTSFEVSLDQVKVAHGRVQVVGTHGQRLAELGAGESWHLPLPAAVEPLPRLETTAAPAQPERAEKSALDVDAQLEHARQALGRRELTRARRLLRQVLDAELQTRQRAEAMSLQAECALVAGQLSAAEAAYVRVAERFAKLPAGENAAFAAARLAADRGQDSALVHYLARYPHGRFVKEANARLRELRRGGAPQP